MTRATAYQKRHAKASHCLDPPGPGTPCRDKLRWMQSMLDGRVATTHQGTVLVEGKSSYVFTLPDGRQVTGSDLQQSGDWPWRDNPQVPGVRYVRLRATSPTYSAVTIIVVREPSKEQCYMMRLDTTISRPRLIRARSTLAAGLAAREQRCARLIPDDRYRRCASLHMCLPGACLRH